MDSRCSKEELAGRRTGEKVDFNLFSVIGFHSPKTTAPYEEQLQLLYIPQRIQRAHLRAPVMLIFLFLFALFRHLQGAPLGPDEGGIPDLLPAVHILPQVDAHCVHEVG